MREIKFRAWDVKEKKMIYYLPLSKISDHNRQLACQSTDGDVEDWIDSWTTPLSGSFILMEYTGFADKNGKEIFEGDLALRCKDKNEKYIFDEDIVLRCIDERFSPIIFRIAMSKKGFGAIKSQSNIEGLISEIAGVVEVIGNIYENPELLKSENL